tara:strand:- start:376 stop:600 length:225 start_codon:yes stop_codon:yes gene_type:complete
MIQWMMISTVLNLNVVYADKTTCNLALEQVNKIDAKAICIPAGQSKSDQKFDNMIKNMMDMVGQLDAMNNSRKE